MAEPGSMRDHMREVKGAEALRYAACDRLGCRYWKSDANFELICAGDRLQALVRHAATICDSTEKLHHIGW